jgi:hypothetical protein
MAINSRRELEAYLISTIGVPPGLASEITASTAFHDGRFRGGGRPWVAFFNRLQREQARNLLAEFGDPEIIPDHVWSEAQGRCVPMNGSNCADYQRRGPFGG